MSQITAAMVKELRERTGAPMMKCKKFLQEVNGDMDEAIKAMRKADPKAADKRADKVAAEGIIRVAVSEDGKKAWIAEINCETDFVARDENFTKFADSLMARIAAEDISDVEAAMAMPFVAGEDATVEQTRQELVAKIGENVKLRRIDVIVADGVVGKYLHGARIGVVAALSTDNAELAKDIAMHVAASKPNVVSGDDMPEEVLKAEREIYVAQAAESGKPAEIVEKMVEGRVKKFLKENSLMGQPFVKDPNQSVQQLLKANGDASVSGFIRFEVGEGIEKKADNFAEEVMAQAGK